MEETNPSPRTNATDPETEELADIVERAESGDDAADTALLEAGGAPSSDEVPDEAVEEIDRVAEPVPASDVTDVPTEEAIADEAEAEPEAEAAEPEPEAEAAEAEPEAPPAEPESPGAEVPAVEAESARDRDVEAAAGVASPFDPPGDWYVVHTYAGYENKVKTNLHSRIGSMQMEDKIFDVVIPMEDVMEIKAGKRQVVQKKVFPGYLLVKMIYDNDSWYVVRNTPGVTGFVSSGTGTKPTPLSRREVEKILAVKEETQAKPQFRLEWEEGDVVRIITGPFADFTGTIAEINLEQSKLKVLVNIFDRETPVELAFDQVAKS
jgi:transcriptional antiterminator NusG